VSDAEDAQALLESARRAAADQRFGDAVARFDAVIERFGDSTDPAVNWLVGDALFGKGDCLARVEREDDALAVYRQMAARYGGDSDFQGQFSRALYQQGTTLARIGRVEEALGAWDELLARFRDVSEPPLVMGVVSAYIGKAAALRRLDRLDEALAVYDELIFRFSDSRFPVLRQRVDAALSEKLFVLLLQRRHDEAIVVGNAAVARLGQAADAEALAIAVLNLGGALASEARFEEAIGVYDALLAQLDDAEAPELRGRLILATSNKVEALVALDRSEEAVAIHSEMLERFGDEVPTAFADAAVRNEYDETAKVVVAGMLLKQALVLAELDRADEARIVVNNLIDRFGEEQGPEFERVMGIAREFQEQLRDGH
jgi:tetratricopeptide (TPR) repeat protein